MAEIQTPLPVKLFVGVLTSIPEAFDHAEKELTRLYGSVDSRSQAFSFDLTHYYDETMGKSIQRRFFSFSELIEPAAIAEMKVQTNELESILGMKWQDIQRPVNLDPGYLEQSKIVLASTKNFYHRILIQGSIYAEVTLHFEAGKWCAFPWTFPDFKTDQYHPFFTSLRNLYRAQLCGMGVPLRV